MAGGIVHYNGRRIVNVLYAIGTNCEVETMEIIRRAGGAPRLVFVWDIISGKDKITDCDLFFVPGGFSFGDHIDAGRIVAILISDYIPYLVEAKIPIGGSCNGNQILIEAKLFGDKVAMSRNASKVFCSHPFVQHRIQKSNCIWTSGMEGEILTFPAAHKFGRFSGKLSDLNVAMTYEGFSPNGGKIAAISSWDGRHFVAMDHPERNLYDPRCVQLFRNALMNA